MTERDWVASADCTGVTQILDPATEAWLTVRTVTIGAFRHLVFVGASEDGSFGAVTATEGTTYRIRSA